MDKEGKIIYPDFGNSNKDEQGLVFMYESEVDKIISQITNVESLEFLKFANNKNFKTLIASYYLYYERPDSKHPIPIVHSIHLELNKYFTNKITKNNFDFSKLTNDLSSFLVAIFSPETTKIFLEKLDAAYEELNTNLLSD